MKLWHGDDVRKAQLAEVAREFGVSAAFDATEPFWYTRLTARFRLTWRRELVTVATVFVAGLSVGCLVARLSAGRAPF
jgi:hypothetical protein